ncbi:MAG: sulfatase-like hydrolase/transferase [Bacteroidales bacterium]|nr:sulfatase-like hydrolase/transferase [Bacteroidales bacterium]
MSPSSRSLLLILAFLLMAPGSLRAADLPPRPGSRPNILFLLADDQSYETIRAFGHTDIDTPNLDRLARAGTTFTHAYNMGSWSGAVCVASRTMLITGRSVWDAGRIYKQTDRERQAGVLWPQLLKQAGYRTYFSGKWHIETDANLCFDVARHIRPGMPKTVPQAYNRPQIGKPDPWSPFDQSLGGFWEGGRHWSEVVADDAIDFLSDARQHREPFFCYLAFNAAHDPRQSPAAFVQHYPLKRIAVPKNFLPEYPHKDKIGCSHKLRDENLAPMPRTEYAVQVHRQEYYAAISHLDAQVGRILDALEKSGQAKNTIIVYTADHGLAVGHHGLMGKQNQYDHSVRVPFLIAGPGVPRNQRRSEAIYLQDVMPTTLELAGAEKPQHLFFHSLLPLLNGTQKSSAYPAVYGAYLAQQRAITVDGWKLIAYPQAGITRLYHLTTDPLEMHDLAGQPQHATHQNELFQQLVRLSADLGDKLKLPPSLIQP